MSYTSLDTWKIIERVQNLSIERQACTLAHLLKFGEVIDRPLRILDLGCGTGHLMSKVRSLLGAEEWSSYRGIDLDGEALCRAKKALGSSAKFVLEDGFQVEDSEENVLISLSNTLLSMGSESDLIAALKRWSAVAFSRRAIWSIVPWDKLRQQWHREFINGQSVMDHQGLLQLKISTYESDGIVTQNFEFNSALRANHRFLSYSIVELTNLLQSCGWMIDGWWDPCSGKKVDPTETPIPEFFVYCRNRIE